jgi:hypothetical protein
MKMLLLSVSLASSLIAAPALAAFEGVLEMKVTSAGGNGTMTVSVGKGGMRNEMQMTARGTPIKMVVVVKSANPNLAYMINDPQKSYMEMDLKKARENAPKGGKATVKKLGTEKIGQYSTVHVSVTREQGPEMEMWTTKDIPIDREFFEAMGQNGPDDNVQKALKEAGADGFPVKMVSKGQDSMTMELVKAEKKSLPASTFEVPAGYTKSESPMMGGPGGGGLTPEQQRMIQEKMKSLTPEQRKMMEEMMKKQRGGQ